MIVKLVFDFCFYLISIPEGYVHSLESLQKEFLDWVENQPECIIQRRGKSIGISYNELDFLKYINDVVLTESREKAYLLPPTSKKIARYTLEF